MKINMIAALSANGCIGQDNKLPWHLPEDLKHFSKTTAGKPVVMGRLTAESLPKVLPNRLNVVISESAFVNLDESVKTIWKTGNQVWVRTPEDALILLESHPEVWIIGGGKIYQAFLEKATELILTRLDTIVDGDTFFPEFELDYSWKLVSAVALQTADGQIQHWVRKS